MKSSSSGSATDAPADPADAAATDASGQSSDQPVFSAIPSTSVSTGSSDTGSTAAVSTATDQTWANTAIAWLITQGASVSMATNAIQKYLAGETLSLDEGKLRDKAIRQFGAPPESGYVQTSTAGYTGPAVKQGNPPTTHTVKGKADNTPQELARLYYGMDNPDVVQYLIANNPSLVTPYRVGQKVSIPRYHSPKYYKSTQRNNTFGEIARINGTTIAAIRSLNPTLISPVPVGTRVRVD
ncbi:MAG TPA: hypothetical protein VN039_01665 [Nitrospira sp.]|nr:hypothetical protein [Nitrospira sp.]